MILKYLRLHTSTVLSLLLASIGLIWQVHSISKVYFQYTTRVDIGIDTPYKISMPGLTVCVCLEDGLGSGGHYKQDTELAYVPINQIKDVAWPEVSVTCTVPAPELVKIKNDSGLFCENFSTPKVTFQYLSHSQIVRCETFFYRRYNETPSEVITSDAKDFYHITIDKIRNSTIYFFVHNPVEIIHISEADTITMNILQMQEMVLVTSKFTTNFLPPPYRTNCRTYDEYDYRQWGCIYDCRIRRFAKICPVWPWNTPAVPEVDLPFKLHDRECRVKIDEHECRFQVCPQPSCWNEWYTTTTIYTKERLDQVRQTNFFIRRPFGLEFVYDYVPKLAQIEYICYVASCFGIWLGISCADCLRFMFDSLQARWKDRQKITRSAVIQADKFDFGGTGKVPRFVAVQRKTGQFHPTSRNRWIHAI